MTNQAVPHKTDAAETRLVDGQAYVGWEDDQGKKTIYALTGVADRVWELIDGERSADDIAEAILDEYDADAEAVRRDVGEVLRSLEDGNFITLSADTSLAR